MKYLPASGDCHRKPVVITAVEIHGMATTSHVRNEKKALRRDRLGGTPLKKCGDPTRTRSPQAAASWLRPPVGPDWPPLNKGRNLSPAVSLSQTRPTHATHPHPSHAPRGSVGVRCPSNQTMVSVSQSHKSAPVLRLTSKIFSVKPSIHAWYSYS